MTTQPPTGESTPQPTAQTMAFQGVANVIVRGLLRMPLVSRAIGSKLVTVYVVGRKSGRHLSVPVAYTKHGDALLIGTPFGWGRNLRTGEPVDIRLKGKRRPADVQVFTDEPNVVDNYAVMARDNPNFARFNKIGFGADGQPNSTDLRKAWVGGARAFRLTPR